MDKSDGDACVCKSTSGNTWCGDLAIQKPNSRLTGGRFNNGFEDCDSSDAGCAPNEKCAKDAFGNSLCYCERKQYYGEFQPPFSAFTEEPYTFNVQFRDDSVPATTLWDFDKLGTSGDCITALFASVSDLLMTRGVPMPVGPLNVQTRRNFYCAVTLTARAPDATYAPPGIYIVDTRTLTAICPDCNVTEIPAVLHPLGRYSTRQSDAQREFGSASVAVTTLSTRCATSCSNTARQRLEQAKTYKAAAQLYYNTCVDGDITCRISQYYSISARQVASEGMNIA
jgi:hypothetical protein